MYICVLPSVPLYCKAGSWSDLHTNAWERSVLFTECFQALLDFAAKVGESAGLLKLIKECPAMRLATTTTANRMPFQTVAFLVSQLPELPTVSLISEKQTCANEVSASKQASKQASKHCAIFLTFSKNSRLFFQGVLYPYSLNAAKSATGLSRRFSFKFNHSTGKDCL